MSINPFDRQKEYLEKVKTLESTNFSLTQTNERLNKTKDENEKEIIRLTNIIERLECRIGNHKFEINELKDLIIKQIKKELERDN